MTSMALSGAVTSVQATLVEYNGFVATPIKQPRLLLTIILILLIAAWTGGSTNGIDQVGEVYGVLLL